MHCWDNVFLYRHPMEATNQALPGRQVYSRVGCGCILSFQLASLAFRSSLFRGHYGGDVFARHQPSEGGVPPTSEPPTHHLAARHVFTSSSARALDPAPSITISVPWDLVGLLHVAVVGAAEGRSVAAHRTCAAPPPVLLPPPPRSDAELNERPNTQLTLPPGSVCAAEDLGAPGR